MYDQAFKAKLENLEQKGELNHFIYDRMVFQKIKDILGGEIKLIISGGAPLSKEVKDFFMVVFCVPVEEVYGVTECAGGVAATSVWDRSTGNVGGPSCVVKIKLRDLPELGYMTTDEPYPRGEVCIKGHSVFKGYFRNKDLTSEVFDKDGWLHLGDVGMILPNGAVQLIDRVKSIAKLQTGIYVAPQCLENIYSQSRAISQIFVSVNANNDSVFAVIVPDKDFILKALLQVVGEMIRFDTAEELREYQKFLNTNKFARKAIIEELRIKEEEFALPQHERASKEGRFYLSALPFVIGQNELPKGKRTRKPQPAGLGILTAGMKIKRIEAERYFAEIIRRTTDKYAGVVEEPVQLDPISSVIELAMSRKHH